MKIVFEGVKHDEKSFKEVVNLFQEAMQKGMNEATKYITVRARENAPEDIRSSIVMKKAEPPEYKTVVKSDHPRAAEFHESPYRGEPQSTPSGGVGNKYIERAATNNATKILEFLATFVTNYLKTRRETKLEQLGNMSDLVE